MLNNFNKLIKSIILEQVEDNDIERIKTAYNTNEFYLRFLVPASEKLNIVLTKQRNNTYLVKGHIKELIKFFNEIKVDKDFMENPNEFKIYSPIFTFGEIKGKLKLDQFYPIQHLERYNVPTTHEIENSTGDIVEGRWYSVFETDDNDGKFIKGISPSEMEKKVFKKLLTKSNKEIVDDNIMYVEFQINTEGLHNLLWDEMTEYAKSPDEMNEFHNSDVDDFDYTQLNVKNENDENVVKAALKNIKRTSKN